MTLTSLPGSSDPGTFIITARTSNAPASVHLDPAYESVLRYEQRASHLRAHGPISHTVAARVLGYLLLHPISPAGRERIAADVSYCCEVDARLYRLGMLFVKYFVHHCE